MDHHSGKRSSSRSRVPAAVEQMIDDSLRNGEVLDAIDSLVAQQLLGQLGGDEVPASLIKVAMDYLKDRGYQPADLSARSKNNGSKSVSMDDMVDWNALPSVEELNEPLDK